MIFSVHDCDNPGRAADILVAWAKKFPDQKLGKDRCGICQASEEWFVIWRTKTGWHIWKSDES